MTEDFYKKRLEKDLAELKKMIDTHFVQRKKDEDELVQLETRIVERKEVTFNIIFNMSFNMIFNMIFIITFNMIFFKINNMTFKGHSFYG